MVKFSNILIGLLNFITLIISIPIVALLLWFKTNPSDSDPSIKLVYWPLLILALFLMVQSLLGLFGACCRISFFLWVYLFITFLLILAVSAFIIFGFVVTNKNIGDAISHKGFNHYRLGNYSSWLQNHVTNADTWGKITISMKETELCSASDETLLATVFKSYKRDLAPLKSDCCTPPVSCGYHYVNSSFWTIPKSGPASKDKDCKTWSNDQANLCFNCDSCKAGMLHYLQTKWKPTSIFLGAFLGFLVIVYSIGCCALRNNRDAKYERYRGAYH